MNQNSGAGRIQLPNEVRVGIEHRSFPVATAVGFTLPGKFVVVGGVSPMIDIAAKVAAGCDQAMEPADVAKRSCAIAIAIFNEEHRLVMEAQAGAVAAQPASPIIQE